MSLRGIGVNGMIVFLSFVVLGGDALVAGFFKTFGNNRPVLGLLAGGESLTALDVATADGKRQRSARERGTT